MLSNAGGMGSIPSWGTKIPHATECGQKKIKLNLQMFKNNFKKLNKQVKYWVGQNRQIDIDTDIDI